MPIDGERPPPRQANWYDGCNRSLAKKIAEQELQAGGPADVSHASLAPSGFMSLREITGKRIIVTHLSNHIPDVILTVHDISHLGVKCHEFVMSECMKSHAPEIISHSPSLYLLV